MASEPNTCCFSNLLSAQLEPGQHPHQVTEATYESAQALTAVTSHVTHQGTGEWPSDFFSVKEGEADGLLRDWNASRQELSVNQGAVWGRSAWSGHTHETKDYEYRPCSAPPQRVSGSQRLRPTLMSTATRTVSSSSGSSHRPLDLVSWRDLGIKLTVISLHNVMQLQLKRRHNAEYCSRLEIELRKRLSCR